MRQKEVGVTGDIASLFTALSNFGAFGILVALLIWKDMRAEKAREKLELDHKAELAALAERRLAYDRERLETDKALAASLAALTGAVQSRGGK